MDHFPDLMQQFLGAGALEHLCIHELKDVFRQIDVCGKKENGHLGLNASKSCGDLSAIGVWHQIIEDNSVKVQSLEKFDAGVGGLSCKDLVAGAFEDGFADLESDFLVVDTQQS